MKIQDVVLYLESLAPLRLQESYDNAGLLTGDASQQVRGVLVSLDCTEAVIDEAIAKNCNLVVCHHPLIFKGLKKLTGAGYVERTVIKSIQSGVAIYAIHTNLDNVAQGVNGRIAEKLGLINPHILQPKEELLRKLAVFCPHTHAEVVREALFAAGAGHIGNYSECSFNLEGYGTFKAGAGTDPYIGEQAQRHTEPETRIEVVYPVYLESGIIRAMQQAHPYEEVAYDSYVLANCWNGVGAGMVGELPEPMEEPRFLEYLKEKMELNVVRYTPLQGKKVTRVALCGGAGSFLLPQAIRSGAQVFVTADFKYHEFFDADGRIVVADIGHYESERFTIDLLGDWIKKKFSNFAVHLTELNTNPINYL